MWNIQHQDEGFVKRQDGQVKIRCMWPFHIKDSVLSTTTIPGLLFLGEVYIIYGGHLKVWKYINFNYINIQSFCQKFEKKSRESSETNKTTYFHTCDEVTFERDTEPSSVCRGIKETGSIGFAFLHVCYVASGHCWKSEYILSQPAWLKRLKTMSLVLCRDVETWSFYISQQVLFSTIQLLEPQKSNLLCSYPTQIALLLSSLCIRCFHSTPLSHRSSSPRCNNSTVTFKRAITPITPRGEISINY